MKFVHLFRKEVKEMLNTQTILSMIVMVMVLIFMGDAMSNAMSDSTEESKDLVIADLDQTNFTEAVLEQLEIQLQEEGGEMKVVDIQSDDYVKELKRLGEKTVVIIPEGFTAQVENNETADLEFVQRMDSLATMSNLSIGSEVAGALIEASVKSTIYAEKMTEGVLNTEEITQLENPITINESTVVADKSASISSSIVMSLCSTQGMFVPIIMFVLIMYSSQMILNAISTEKIDKTLETLLSAPVSRLSVLFSKMLAAGVVAALQAIAYMFGMNKMMSAMTSGVGDTEQYSGALETLGLTMSTSQYI
ncbi:MAG: ABC transporter permease, partial [Hominimerdicola sp.]